MPLAVYQAKLRDLTMGAGTPYEFRGPIEGLSLAGGRGPIFELFDEDGAQGDADFLPPRPLTLPLQIDADTPEDAGDNLEELKAAFGPAQEAGADIELELRVPTGGGHTYVVFGQPRGVEDDLGLYRSSHLEVDGLFRALDPVLYGALQVASATLASAQSGVGFDATFDLTFGGVSGISNIDALNSGRYRTWPFFRIDAGPNGVDQPRIENVITGASLELDLTLDPGDFLLIETHPRRRSVLLNGTASRRGKLAGTFFSLPAMTTTEIRYAADTVKEGSTLSAQWRPAWL